MERQQLKATLGELHQELSAHPAVDPEVRTLLRQLSDDINALLAEAPSEGTARASTSSTSSPESDKQTALDNVLSLANEFEKSHPQLAAALGRVADALSRLGI